MLVMMVRRSPKPAAPPHVSPPCPASSLPQQGLGTTVHFLARCLTDTQVDTWRVVLAWLTSAPLPSPASSLGWAPAASPGSLTRCVAVSLAESLPRSGV